MVRILAILLSILGLLIFFFFWPGGLLIIGLSILMFYSGSRKRCPHCGELVYHRALICRYCKEPFRRITIREGYRAFMDQFKD